MTYVKTYLSTLKTHVVNLERDAKGLSRDLQRLEVRGKLGSKTLQYCGRNVAIYIIRDYRETNEQSSSPILHHDEQ